MGFSISKIFGGLLAALRYQRTLAIIKPDALFLKDQIISYIQREGLKITSQKIHQISGAEAEKLYQMHKGKSFYSGLIDYMTSSPVLIMLVEGRNVIARLRKIMGPTDPLSAPKGTIRGDLKVEPVRDERGIIHNLIHGSDSEENAGDEIKNFF